MRTVAWGAAWGAKSSQSSDRCFCAAGDVEPFSVVRWALGQPSSPINRIKVGSSGGLVRDVVMGTVVGVRGAFCGSICVILFLGGPAAIIIS